MDIRPIVVLDSNVLVSARLQIQAGNLDSPSVALFTAILDERITLITSAPLLFELCATLQKPRLRSKYGLTDQDAVDWMETTATVASDIVHVAGLDFGCRDPRDNMVVETAYNGRASHLVARDNDLTDPTAQRQLVKRSIRVVNVGTFLSGLLSIE